MAQRKRPKRARTLRRARERAAEQLAEQREKLFALEPGGRPERPIEVESAAVVESRADRCECPRCGGPLRVEGHAAETRAGARLRRVDLSCRRCGSRRPLWLRIVRDALN